MKYILFLLYDYYSDKDSKHKGIPFFSAIGTFAVLIFFNIMSLVLILNIEVDSYVSWLNSKTKGERTVYVLLFYVLPIYLFFYIFFKEDDIRKLTYSENKIKLGKKFLLFYFIFSIVFFCVMNYHRNA